MATRNDPAMDRVRGWDVKTVPQSFHIDIQAVDAIPPELRSEKRWIVCAWVWKAGKWTKPPINPVTGETIDQTDPANWLMFDEARKASLNRGDGIGVALGSKDDRLGVVGIDLDKCIDPMTGLVNSDEWKLSGISITYARGLPAAQD